MPDLAHTIPRGFKLGKWALGQYKRRAMIRLALKEAAPLLMQRLKAPSALQKRFQRTVMQLMQTTGTKPIRIKPRLKSRFRGGPATLFDGPEARHWQNEVRELGEQAFRQLREQEGSTADHDWFDSWKASDERFGQEYLDEVMQFVGNRAEEDDYAPEWAIFAEQGHTNDVGRFRATCLRITKFALAAAAGVAIGHSVGSATAAPDWVDTGTGAVIVSTLAAASMSHEEKAKRVQITAEMPNFISYTRLRLKIPLRAIVSTLASICDPSRAPPKANPESLSDQVIEALDRLSRITTGCGLELRVSDKQRIALAQATATLATEVELSQFGTIDSETARTATRLVNLVNDIIGEQSTEYQRQLELGCTFVQALRAALNVAVRLEDASPMEPPEDPTGNIHLKAA